MQPGNYIREVAESYASEGRMAAERWFRREFSEKEGIVFMADIAGFTEFCNGNPPETVQLLIRRFCREVSNSFFDSKIDILKFIGDAVFGIGKLEGITSFDIRGFITRINTICEKHKVGITFFSVFFKKFLYEGGVPNISYSEYNFFGPGVNAVFKLSKRLPRNYVYICDRIQREIGATNFKKVWPQPDIEPEIILWAAKVKDIM